MNLLLATNDAAAELQTEPTIVTEIMTVFEQRATIKVIGPISRYGRFFTSTESIHAAITLAMGMDNITELLFEVDSNGGDARGIFDLSSRIRKLKGKKTAAYVTGTCASAALVLATACSKLIISPSATLGSVGVIMSVLNNDTGDIITKYVSDQAPRKIESPGDVQFDLSIQDRVNFLHDLFIAQLKLNLNNDNEDYGDGKMYNSIEAVEIFNAKIKEEYPPVTTIKAVKQEASLETNMETNDMEKLPTIKDMENAIIKKERQRVSDIKSVAIEGHTTLIEMCIANGETLEATMRMILVAEKKTKEKIIAEFANDDVAPILNVESTTDDDEFISMEIKEAYEQRASTGRVNIKGVK